MLQISASHNWVPFILQNWQKAKPMKIDFQAILQALITAAITAAIVMYGAILVLDAKFAAMQKDLQRVEQSVNRIQQDFYPPVSRNGR